MKIYKEIVQKLNNDLEVLETEVEDVLVKAEKGMKLTRHSLKNIRSLVVDKAFKTSKDEITFFKGIHPLLRKIYVCWNDSFISLEVYLMINSDQSTIELKF